MMGMGFSGSTRFRTSAPYFRGCERLAIMMTSSAASTGLVRWVGGRPSPPVCAAKAVYAPRSAVNEKTPAIRGLVYDGPAARVAAKPLHGPDKIRTCDLVLISVQFFS
jgi:hypothetical protein